MLRFAILAGFILNMPNNTTGEPNTVTNRLYVGVLPIEILNDFQDAFQAFKRGTRASSSCPQTQRALPHNKCPRNRALWPYCYFFAICKTANL